MPIPLRIVFAAAATAPATVVVQAILEKDADGLALALTDEVGINVPAADVREAADGADDFAELIRPLPRNGKRANGSRTCPADGAVVRVFGNVVILFERGQQFVDDEIGSIARSKQGVVCWVRVKKVVLIR